MKFAKIVFYFAGIWGIVVTLPLYFSYGYIGHRSPPPITHPEFYFGFTGVTLAWQFAFLLIAGDPARYRPIMIPSILEKVSYILAISALLLSGCISTSEATPAVSDLVLAVLFIAAFFRTRPVQP